jgi:hypothetical protein
MSDAALCWLCGAVLVLPIVLNCAVFALCAMAEDDAEEQVP